MLSLLIERPARLSKFWGALLNGRHYLGESELFTDKPLVAKMTGTVAS